MIETERLILKQVTLEDTDLYAEIMKSAELTKYLPKGQPYTDEEIIDHVAGRVSHWEQGFGSYIIFFKSEGVIKIGYAGVEVSPVPGYCDIRYGLIKSAQGKGYASEAAQAVIKETFKTGRHEKIFGAAFEDNRPSVAILEKLGMRPDPVIKLYDDAGLITMSLKRFI